jgi:hypothetical protein
MRSFLEIGQDLTDKVYHHHYDRFYPMFLEPLRNQEFNMLEIGIHEGGSFLLWEEYFPKANLYGVDINSEWKNDRCKTFKFDQSNPEDLKEMTRVIPKCKFIIDDGSHIPQHQLITFLELFDNLLDYGGIYIIEDIECNYWDSTVELYGYPSGHFNVVDYLKHVPDQINSEFSKHRNDLNISTITFAHNCIIITKKTEEEIELTKREYRFSNAL